MKVASSYANLIRGVSEQPPHMRLDGQHGEQINMIPDPVLGLVRRWGTRLVAERQTALSPAAFAAMTTDVKTWRTFKYENAGKQYALLIRRDPPPVGSPLPPMVVYNKTDGVFMDLVRPVSDAAVDALAAGGCSAVAAIGKYVFLAGNTVVPTATTSNLWADATNQSRAVLWVRGGAFSRTFKARAKTTSGTVIEFSYKTPAAAYPGLLDTSSVNPLAPDLAGSSTGTGPSVGTESELVTAPVTGATHTLARAGSVITNLSVTFYFTNSDDVQSGEFYEGVHYSLSPAGVLTWLTTGPGTGLGVTLTYNYQTSSSGGSTTIFQTATDTETLHIRRVLQSGVATLSWGTWNPTGLTVRDGQRTMTNVHPSTTPPAGSYSWAPGSKAVLFNVAEVDKLSITATYTHTKTIPNPNYANIIADMTAEYQRAVTAWIASSSAAIAPAAIAGKLAEAAIAAGLTTAATTDSTISFVNVVELTAEDGGDGSLIRAVANEVGNPTDVSLLHYAGKVVKVRPANGEEAFYLKAVPRNAGVASGVVPVTWEEGAAVEHTITGGLLYGTASGTSFYLAGTAAGLNSILPGTHPEFSKSTVGDLDTVPLPHFIGRKISYLGVFQDRLLVGSGAVIRASKVGDYLNFFKTSVLTAPADDPVEMLSQGSEDDELRHSVLYDRDLIIFGRDRQYAISGRQALGPTSANMPVMSSHEGAADAPPLAVGGMIFYSKRSDGFITVHQIQPGQVAESPESFPISTQVARYMPGNAVELLNVASPSMLLLRSDATPHRLSVFHYLDVYGERRQDAWHKWEYAEALGPIMGIDYTPAGVLTFSLRKAAKADATGDAVWFVADLQPLAAGLSSRPYLDSARSWAVVSGSTSTRSVNPATLGAWFSAYDSSTVYRFLGVPLNETTAYVTAQGTGQGLWVGHEYGASVELTNPVVRDNKGQAILDGRLTVQAVDITFKDSTGFNATIVANRLSSDVMFNGRIVGDPNNLIGRQPVTSGNRSVVVGRERAAYSLTIKARTWLPLNITNISWSGQFFNKTRRV